MRETAVVEKYRKRLESSFLDFHLLDSHDFCGLDDGGLLILERVRLHSLSFIRIINNVLSFAKFLGFCVFDHIVLVFSFGIHL